MPLRVENLRYLGWQPYTVQSFQSWCGHRQEIIPFPREDGSVLFIDVVGCAAACADHADTHSRPQPQEQVTSQRDSSVTRCLPAGSA